MLRLQVICIHIMKLMQIKVFQSLSKSALRDAVSVRFVCSHMYLKPYRLNQIAQILLHDLNAA